MKAADKVDVEVMWKRTRDFAIKEKFVIITAKARPVPSTTPKYPVFFDYINKLS